MYARTLFTCLIVLAAAGCASYGGAGLVPGASTSADLRAAMGEPAAIHKAAPGATYAESWEYPRGPLGRQTFMARLDSQGRLAVIDQVLTVAEVAKLKAGETTKDEVRRVLGRPGFTGPVRGAASTGTTPRRRRTYPCARFVWSSILTRVASSPRRARVTTPKSSTPTAALEAARSEQRRDTS